MPRSSLPELPPLLFMHRELPIVESCEPLVPIPVAHFARFDPHPYVALGAPYGQASPWQLRQGVLRALEEAQFVLAECHPGWRFKLFDAWRPLAVQAFMVWREFVQQAQFLGESLPEVDSPQALQQQAPDIYARLAGRVFEFWSLPEEDPLCPPPHSTGAAVDLTLVDAAGQEVSMGSPIDEVSPRSWPDHFAGIQTSGAQAFHAHRECLNAVMTAAGFCRHPNEWWHFSLGDQMWAWQRGEAAARYGRIVSTLPTLPSQPLP